MIKPTKLPAAPTEVPIPEDVAPCSERQDSFGHGPSKKEALCKASCTDMGGGVEKYIINKKFKSLEKLLQVKRDGMFLIENGSYGIAGRYETDA